MKHHYTIKMQEQEKALKSLFNTCDLIMDSHISESEKLSEAYDLIDQQAAEIDLLRAKVNEKEYPNTVI